MKAGINIQGAVPTQESCEAVSDAIDKILGSAHAYHADQETTRFALEQLGRLGVVSDVSIHGAHVQGPL